MIKALLTRNLIAIFSVLCSLVFSQAFSEKIEASQAKVLICGVCKNVGRRIRHSIKNIEKLGNQFKDYAVIIYENNSSDRTPAILSKWAKKNNRVFFISETVPPNRTPRLRTEKIARARNIVLAQAKKSKYRDYPYLIMVDLDFISEWPIQEIVKSIELPIEWDSISANGVRPNDTYVDRFAFRDANFPLGDELLGNPWWPAMHQSLFVLIGQEDLSPVYSAFGGLAIYKTAIITQFSYSGTVTKDLHNYYGKILQATPPSNPQMQDYLKLLGRESETDFSQIPIRFLYSRCCEHVTMHASMALQGHGKFFVNPKMVMRYPATDHSIL